MTVTVEDVEPEDSVEDPRIAAAEEERICPYVETGPDIVHWHYPDPNWGRQER